MIDTAKLREIATKATPGRWMVEPHGDTTALYSDRNPMVQHGLRLLNLDDGDWNFEANAAHIAAFDPPTVLALIDQRDSARALLRKTVPHIKRARAAYKDGWIEEKQEILSEIAAELGEVT